MNLNEVNMHFISTDFTLTDTKDFLHDHYCVKFAISYLLMERRKFVKTALHNDLQTPEDLCILEKN